MSSPPFKIYYGDGSTFSGLPEDAPVDNVQVIVWNDPARDVTNIGRYELREYDIYIYSDPIGWHGTDKYYDLIQHLQRGCGKGGVRAVLTGRWIPWADYQSILKRVNEDEEFSPKSAVRKTEDGRA